MTGRDEDQARALFRERYRNAPSLLARQIEQLTPRTGVVAAAASALPFRPNSFDVVIHTDVLC